MFGWGFATGLLLIFALVVGFVCGVLVQAALVYFALKTHDFTMQNGKAKWVKRDDKR